jgi:lipid-binding SYLF domain-containing protein
VLLIRKSKNKFTGPFFYSIGGLSVGLQFGAKSGKVVMTVMTNRGLKSILKERLKFGVDVDAVVVSDGIGYSAESTLRLADIYSFTDNKGLFLGSSIEGSYLQPRNDLNRMLYKKDLDSDEILKQEKPKNEISNIIKIIGNIIGNKSEKKQ